MTSSEFPIPPSEYQQKRYEIARELLASTLGASNIDMTDADTKKSENLVYNCCLITDILMQGLGYTIGTAPRPKSDSQETSVRSLKDLLKKSTDE